MPVTAVASKLKSKLYRKKIVAVINVTANRKKIKIKIVANSCIACAKPTCLKFHIFLFIGAQKKTSMCVNVLCVLITGGLKLNVPAYKRVDWVKEVATGHLWV